MICFGSLHTCAYEIALMWQLYLAIMIQVMGISVCNPFWIIARFITYAHMQLSCLVYCYILEYESLLTAHIFNMCLETFYTENVLFVEILYWPYGRL